ncbi:MAG: hypothetical protein JSW06_03020 [Thermoplasmatales archaeon]|nr:MAG: hypothetical protein JSW06_03020 [Thermoplasmatales archaeon]
MGIATDERNIFNSALTQVETTNKRLLKIYEESQARVEQQLLKMRAQVLKSGVVQPFKEARLVNLLKAINEEIASLRTQSQNVIASGYIANYQNTYYLELYAYEKSINTELSLGADYLLNAPALNRQAVIASLNERIGGNAFKDRMLRHQREMQFLLRDAVSQNIIEGQTVKELAKNIDLIGEVYGRAINQSTRIARTELLTAYSIGQEQATLEAEESGVEFTYKWSATLDSRVRKDHARADGQKALIVDGGPVFTVGGVRFSSPRVPLVNDGSKRNAKQVINCRCRRLNIPFGIEPTKRVAKRKDDTWTELNGDLTAVEWIRREYGINLTNGI